MGNGKSRFGFILAGLLIGIFVSAMDNTIVATAMGTIVAQLGGLDKFVWVTSAYLVTEMAGMPIFGKLSDMYGRKRFFVFGLCVFLLGSILCGTAQDITQLALYRAIQGVGGGALMPIAFSIIFDVVPPDKAGKLSGMFGAVFGLASIIGPLLGAYITQYISWRWIFYINIPAGIVALALIGLYYKESLRHASQKIDWWGTITLVPAVGCLMFGLEFGGNKYAWDSTQIIGLFAAAAVLFIAFLVAEARAAEPIISYAMFRKRLFAGSNLVGVFSSAAYVVVVVYVPIYVQGVLGGSATSSALVLLPMMLGSTVSAPLGGQLVNKINYRSIMFVSCVILTVGIWLLTTITTDTSHLVLTLYMIIVGFGIGASFSVLSMAAMHHFDETQRGAASATMSFVRELGMTVGITVFGIIQRNLFKGDLASLFQGMPRVNQSWNLTDPHAMLAPGARAHIPAAVLDKLSTGLASSVAHTFLWTLIPAVLSIVFVFWLGGERWGGFKRAEVVEPAAQE